MITKWISTPDSSNVAGFGFDEGTKEILVLFVNGSMYAYDPAVSVFEAMQRAESKGQFVHRALKESGMQVRKVH